MLVSSVYSYIIKSFFSNLSLKRTARDKALSQLAAIIGALSLAVGFNRRIFGLNPISQSFLFKIRHFQ
jgi:hypothetical protein